MGWCSATHIIDTAIDMADEVINLNTPPGLDDDTQIYVRQRYDRMLRPKVRALASQLRDEDWDCIDESAHYHRFGPEMEGVTDAEFRTKMADKLSPEDFATWLRDVWEPQTRDPRTGE